MALRYQVTSIENFQNDAHVKWRFCLNLILLISDVCPLYRRCFLGLQNDTWLKLNDFGLMSILFDNIGH